MTDLRQNPNGTWTPSEPLSLTGDFDIEVHGTGPWVWQAWVGLDRVASGRARTRLGLWFGIARAARKHRKANR